MTADALDLKALLDVSPVGLSISVGGILRFANPRFHELLGIPLGGSMTAAYASPAEREAVMERLKREGTVRDHELRINQPGKPPLRLLFTLRRMPYQGEDAVFGWAVDVTHLKQTEETLSRASMLADSALDLTRAGYWYIDVDDLEYYEASDRARDLFGEPPRPGGRYHRVLEFGNRIAEVDPGIAAQVADLFQGALDGKYERYDATYPYRRPADGRIIWTRARGHVVRDDTGRAREMYGVNQDITEQYHAEQALQVSEDRLDGATRGSNLGLWDVNVATGEIHV